jgi:hypothetical protein
MRDNHFPTDYSTSKREDGEQRVLSVSSPLVTRMVDHIQRVREHLERAHATARHARELYEEQGDELDAAYEALRRREQITTAEQRGMTQQSPNETSSH